MKRSSKSQTEAQLAPGMLDRHYSPRTPAHLVNVFPTEKNLSTRAAWVYLKHPRPYELDWATQAGAQSFWLSESGDVAEMMQNVYELLHNLDSGDFSVIFIQKPELKNLSGAEALIDRLSRACVSM
jgi:L-threonylcarbamoyladenylate synthase